jgi:hypothetical protein
MSKSQEGRPPVVFNFQPTGFKELSTPDELKEWERMMKDEVGFKGDFSNLAGSCTESESAGRSDDCDQD